MNFLTKKDGLDTISQIPYDYYFFNVWERSSADIKKNVFGSLLKNSYCNLTLSL